MSFWEKAGCLILKCLYYVEISQKIFTSCLNFLFLPCISKIIGMVVSLWLQILYDNEGESKKEQEFPAESSGEKSNYICHKGHEFIPTLYHFPTNCEACMKPLWHMFKPPPALECRRCHIKCHKDHMDKKEEIIAPCKGMQEIIVSHNWAGLL